MMDQLEFENCINKIKRRKDEGDYKTAAKIADKIPWDEVEDINLLLFAASIYESAEKYSDAKMILEYAYEIAPVKNRLYFAMSLIYTKCRDLKEGVNYYIDFINAFPEDNRKLLLKYYILKAKGAPYDQLKRILEEYIKEDKDEEMIFELALIADKLDEEEEVLTYCNYIIEFFGVKKSGYGKNALLLKKKYLPLTEQEERLLENANIGYVRDEDKEIEYKEMPNLYNETRIEEDKINIPVEKVDRVVLNNNEEDLQVAIKIKEDEELDESLIDRKPRISYTPDEESYQDKNRDNMAFLTEKEKLKNMIKQLKEEEKALKGEFNKFRINTIVLGRRKKQMKLNETKLHMIIEAYNVEEGVDIAKKELNYIREVLKEKFSTAKASARNINEKGFSYYKEKIRGKDLIIEEAGLLRKIVIDEIEEYMTTKSDKGLIVLVDSINNFDNLATERPSFVNKFDIYSVLSTRPQETLELDEENDIIIEKEENKEIQRNVEFIKREERERINEENTKKEEKVERPERIEKEERPERIEKFEKEKVLEKREPLKKIVKEKFEPKQPEQNPQQAHINQNKKIEEFVNMCKEYTKSIDCVISSDAIDILYEKAEDLIEENIPLNEDSAMALIEEAADMAEKPKLFSKPKYDKKGFLILAKEHFEF